jgi:hypothetical protein
MEPSGRARRRLRTREGKPVRSSSFRHDHGSPSGPRREKPKNQRCPRPPTSSKTSRQTNARTTFLTDCPHPAIGAARNLGMERGRPDPVLTAAANSVRSGRRDRLRRSCGRQAEWIQRCAGRRSGSAGPDPLNELRRRSCGRIGDVGCAMEPITLRG